jgi:hypothetical protein
MHIHTHVVTSHPISNKKQLKTLFKSVLDAKEARWTAAQRDAEKRMLELSTYFSGDAALTRVAKNDNLVAWFAQLVGGAYGFF